jgi:hypothetical protein
MIERIVILFKVLFKMSDSLYMLRCSSRSYFARYTVILNTSRESSHHVILSQICFCIVACDILTQNMNCKRFFIISIFSKMIENLTLHFLKFFLQTRNFLFTHSVHAKMTLISDRKLYKKKWCDQIRTWFNSH